MNPHTRFPTRHLTGPLPGGPFGRKLAHRRMTDRLRQTVMAAGFSEFEDARQAPGTLPPVASGLSRYRQQFEDQSRRLNAATRQAASIAETPAQTPPGPLLRTHDQEKS